MVKAVNKSSAAILAADKMDEKGKWENADVLNQIRHKLAAK